MTATQPLYWIELATGELWLANDPAHLVGGLLPGYLKLGLEARTAARRAYATTVARTVQDRLLSEAITDETIDLSSIPDEILDRLMGEGDYDEVTSWDFEPIPLIVIAGAAEDWLPPTGNVLVVDAGLDGLLLLSLARLREIATLGLVSGPALLAHPLGL